MCCGALLQKKQKQKIWPSSEIDFLKERFSSLRLKEIAIKLNRSFRAVCVKAHKLGLKKERRWIEEEINFLKNNYSVLSLRECALKLNRTVPAIQSKAHILRLTEDKRWTEKELIWLKNNYSVLSPKECAFRLGRTVFAVENKAYKLRLTNNKTWSSAEIARLKECYLEKKNERRLPKEIYKKNPNRTKRAITLKASRLGYATNNNLRYERVFSALRNDSDFSYIQGVMDGDGTYMYCPKKRYILRVEVADKDFSDYFYEKLRKWSELEPRRYTRTPKEEHRKKLYTVTLSSKAVLDFLNNNRGNVSDFKEYLKGFYDSEGHARYYKLKGKKWFFREVHTVNTDFRLIEKIEAYLNKSGVKTSVYVKKGKNGRKNAKELAISNYVGIKWFYDNIGFRIDRKQRVLEQIIKDGVKFTKSSYPTNPTTQS